MDDYKYDDSQPRDENGRWSGGGAGESGVARVDRKISAVRQAIRGAQNANTIDDVRQLMKPLVDAGAISQANVDSRIESMQAFHRAIGHEGDTLHEVLRQGIRGDLNHTLDALHAERQREKNKELEQRPKRWGAHWVYK